MAKTFEEWESKQPEGPADEQAAWNAATHARDDELSEKDARIADLERKLKQVKELAGRMGWDDELQAALHEDGQ